MIKIVSLTFLFTLFLSLPSKQQINALQIDSSLRPLKKLSELPFDFQHKKITKPGDQEIDRVLDFFCNEDRIIVGFRAKPKEENRLFIAIYNETGVFYKNVPYSGDIFISSEQKRMYLTEGNHVKVLNFSGELIEVIQLPHKADNIVCVDNAFYYDTMLAAKTGSSSIALFKYNLQTSESTLLKEIEYKNLKVKNSIISAKGRLWIDFKTIYWGIGIKSNLYRINGSDIFSINVDFDYERNYMDQIQTGYGTISNYLFCNFSKGFRKNIFFKNRQNEKVWLLASKLEDDIYGTGAFRFARNQQKRLFFSKSSSDLNPKFRRQFKSKDEDTLLFYSN